MKKIVYLLAVGAFLSFGATTYACDGGKCAKGKKTAAELKACKEKCEAKGIKCEMASKAEAKEEECHSKGMKADHSCCAKKEAKKTTTEKVEKSESKS